MRAAPIVHHYDGTAWTCLLCGRMSVDPCDCSCCRGRADGMLIVSTQTATVGLLVRDAVVIGGPPYARRRWLRRTVTEVLADVWPQRGANISWIPD